MNISMKNIREKDCVCDVLILPCTEGDPQLPDGFGREAENQVRKIFKREFTGKKNEVFLFPSPPGLKPERLLLIGLGKKEELSPERLRQAGGKAATYLRDMGMKKVALSTRVISSSGLSASDFAEGALLGLYSYKKYKKDKNGRKSLSQMTILSKSSTTLQGAINKVKITASAVNFARDLINTPANDLTPSHLAGIAKSLRGNSLSAKVYDAHDAKRLGMETFLSVAKGSHEPPKFIVVEYRGAKGSPVVLIGKSITFDSGGISLKPAEGMEKMKYDMAGGAAVLAVMKAVSELKMPIHLIGMLPATENLPGGCATRPGDVVSSVEGLTVEIVNTDAEGRLALADAIGYAKRYNPYAIIDIATLTGACSVALGNEAAAMMGNDRDLLDRIKKAAEITAEKVWEMPLFEEYNEYIKSDVADIKNTGGKTGSLATSAYFLYRFAGKVPWVHLDIAGTAWTEKDRPYTPRGATGIGVRLLITLMKEML